MQRNQTRWPSKPSYTIQELPRFNRCLSLLLLCGYLSFPSIKGWTCFWKRPHKFISEFFSNIMKKSKKQIIPIPLEEQHFKFVLNKHMWVYLSIYLTHIYLVPAVFSLLPLLSELVQRETLEFKDCQYSEQMLSQSFSQLLKQNNIPNYFKCCWPMVLFTNHNGLLKNTDTDCSN